ncbi:hypothetical protein [Pectinatus cerevisiiphilus]|uniref:DUF340 domain-containing protein n=1 Tax=Pectinatus cerevisiiphilus TaxID=86956 RepID=A0A4R3K6E6_9FIRM|nr:hypothetical protein [Pectinatus cerevisiiphilus]TCS78375.1 hypothetical protein EDC37_1103 [Pectinatus cerevisiiphilus]
MKDTWADIIFILITTAVLVLISNIVGYGGSIQRDLIGALLLAVIAAGGVFLARLPLLNKLPIVFWVSVLAVVLSVPGVPGAEWIVAKTKDINFLATTTPILAYAGLALGKEIEGFKKLSWRIVPICLAVSTGSFVCATLMAEIMLHLEGIF